MIQPILYRNLRSKEKPDIIHPSKEMEPLQIKNRLRIIELSYQSKTSHLGSALSAVDIIEAVYQIKNPEEKFILSAGHAACALYAVLENHNYLSPSQANIKKLGAHPTRNPKIGIDLSTGSLGQGLPIATGMALANKGKNVYCCISDGECAEGSVAEALRIGAEKKLVNLKIIVNANGYAAYQKTDLSCIAKYFKGLNWKVIWADGHDLKEIKRKLIPKNIRPTIVMAKTKVDQLPFLKGLGAHYYIMNKGNYLKAKKKWLELLEGKKSQ